jgi:hypothetical protein
VFLAGAAGLVSGVGTGDDADVSSVTMPESYQDMMANRSKTTKDATDLELEKVLHLSTDDLGHVREAGRLSRRRLTPYC